MVILESWWSERLLPFNSPSFLKRELEGVNVFINNVPKHKLLRKQLRKNSTDTERKVWNILRNKQIQNLKFFRQYGMGNYILDFYCPRIKLAIELDGGQHFEERQIEADNKRTEYLKFLRIKVIRFQNNDVLQNLEGVHQRIAEIINSPHPSL